MVSLEVVAILLSGISISASLVYYSTVLKNQNETRQAQLFMQIYNEFKDKEFQSDFQYAITAEWENYEDYRHKYMGEENISKGIRIGIFTSFCEGLGVLVYRKLVDITLVDDLMRGYIIRYWDKYSGLRHEIRKNSPLYAEWTEYLYNELMKIESKPGYLRKNR
jgi:hypothetical protein